MLELCFSHSFYCSLRCAPRKPFTDTTRNGEGVLISRAEGISDEEYERRCAEEAERFHQRRIAAIPFETAVSDLHYFDFDLSMGDITQPVETPNGPFEKQYMAIRHNQEDDNHSKTIQLGKKNWEQSIKSYERFKEKIQDGEAVRIWLDSVPTDICGFLFAMELLSETSSKVSVISLPKYEVIEGSVVEHSSWCEIDPLVLYKYTDKEQELPKEIIKALAYKWCELKKENAPLRACVNGNVVSVEEDFYDSFIRQAFPTDECTVVRIIGEVIANHRLFMTDYLIAKRIKKMLDDGELVYRQKLDHDFYHSIIAVNK